MIYRWIFLFISDLITISEFTQKTKKKMILSYSFTGVFTIN